MPQHNPFKLLIQKRFAPFFWTQFGGAFNDNVFRNALIILLAFNDHAFGIDRDILINICAGLFILPFALFSSTAGQLADKYNKVYLIRTIKFAEIGLSCIAFIAFYIKNTSLLIFILFLLGTQSAFFGPVKYSILPEYLKRSELLGGNGLVEMGTFIAILTGTITGGILMSSSEQPGLWIAGTLLTIATLGFIASLNMPTKPPTDPTLKINWNVFQTTLNLLKQCTKRSHLFLAIMGISWFWAYGGTFITQLPHYVQIHLQGDEEVATLFLATFSIGIGIGSILCERFSSDRIELGLVPWGSIGMTLVILDLAFAHPTLLPESPQNALLFLQHLSSWHIIFDLLLIGFFAGLYVVPLYTFLQDRSPPKIRSQMIAANNLMNTIFMVSMALLAIGIYHLDLNTPQLFLIMGILNACIAIYIFRKLPKI